MFPQFTAPASPHWRMTLWIVILITASMALSLSFACALPFAALAAIAALTLPRNAALWLVGGAWLANQALGYLVLNYPQDVNSYAWGVLIGIAALLCLAMAQAVVIRTPRLGLIPRASLVFAAAFVTYEGALLISTVTSLGPLHSFSTDIVAGILIANLASFLVLMLASWINTVTGFLPASVFQRTEI